MCTDTQRLDWLLGIVESQDDDAAARLTAAYTLELRGRPMLDAAMGAKVIEPGEPMPALTAIDLATAELGRIRNVKGFSEERDDGYDGQELVWASIAYLTPGDERHDHGGGPEVWPWSEGRFKPSPDDRKKELTKGIALALCELDRLIRAERRQDEAEFDAAMDAGLPAADYAPREFKVGDRVRIAKKAEGSGYVWDERMDATIGNLGEIIEAAETPSTLEPQYRIGFWYYLADSLEHADD